MNDTTTRTILSLDEQRSKAQQEAHELRLELAQLRHQGDHLRHFRREVRRLLRERPETESQCRHLLGRIARLERNAG